MQHRCGVERKNRFIKVLNNEKGFTLFILLASIVMMGISTTIGVKQWKVMVQQDKEAELLFRGDQIRRGIEAYLLGPGRGLKYPKSLEDLVGGGFKGRNYVRRLFKDPITNGEWELLGKNRLVGIRSSSNQVPLKTGNFPPAYQCFEEAQTYRDWVFIYVKSAKNNESPCLSHVDTKKLER